MKYLFPKCLILFAVLILMPSFIFSQNKSTVSYQKLFYEGAYADVIKALQTAEPKTRTAEEWFYLAQSYSALKDYQNALKAFRTAVEKAPDNPGYKLSLARLLNIYGSTKEAIKIYNELLTADSLNVTALSELGLIHISSKEYSKSLPMFEKLARLNSSDFLSNYYVAYSLNQLGRAQADSVKFINSLENCIKINWNYIPANDLYASYYYSKGDYTHAMHRYSGITLLVPNNPDPIYKKGLCLEKMKWNDYAATIFKMAVKLDSANFNYYSHLGYNYFLSGKNDSAIAAFKSALELNKDNATVQLNLGMAYLNMDSLSVSKRYFEKAAANFGIEQYTFIQNQLAYINLKQRNIKPAKEYCEKVLTLDPFNASAQFNLARCFDELGNSKAALANYQKAVPLMQNLPSLKKEYEHAQKRLKELKK